MVRTGVIAAWLAAALGGGAAQAGDINSMEEALAEAGTCVYPAGYVDTLAQGSMAPSADEAPSVAGVSRAPDGAAPGTAALIARIIAARDYAGGMTPLPVPLSRLVRPEGS